MLRALNDALRVVEDLRQETVISSFNTDEYKYHQNSLTLADPDPVNIDPRTNNQDVSRRWSITSTIGDVEHIETAPLDQNARVGFSIQNLTGYPIRYLQTWEDGNRMTVQYLQHGERGLLNFIASKTIIRDNEILEESFSSQSYTDYKSSMNRQVGHQVALQIAGYQWLEGVQADSLGVRFEDLNVVIGRLNLPNLHHKFKIIGNSLKLVTEVRPHNGGRLLQLSSVFMVKNATMHPLHIRATISEDSTQPFNSAPFIVHPGATFNVPLSLLSQSVLHSKGISSKGNDAGCPRSLGYLWLVPSGKEIIVDDLGVSLQMIGDVKYTAMPIDLMQVVKRTQELGMELVQRDAFDGIIPHDGIFELACDVMNQTGRTSQRSQNTSEPLQRESEEYESQKSSRIINLDKFPCFRYNVEVEAATHIKGNLNDLDMAEAENQNQVRRLFFASKDRSEVISNNPCTYTIGKSSLTNFTFISDTSPLCC
jgi:hypothetical protein